VPPHGVIDIGLLHAIFFDDTRQFGVCRTVARRSIREAAGRLT
jgi:hypothetical protein